MRQYVTMTFIYIFLVIVVFDNSYFLCYRFIFFFFCVYFFFFFFFQAEDGIRDKLVTGVQTCALPICVELPRAPHVGHAPPHRSASRQVLVDPRERRGRAREAVIRAGLLRRGIRESRSEERRVGKECRSRWSPDD